MKNSFSRRKFIRTSALGTGALLTTQTIQLEPQPFDVSNRKIAPGDSIRFGIIGVGMQGSGLLSTAISLPGAECVAAADLYDGRHTLAKEISSNPNLFTTRNYRELLNRKDIDCIIAAVPDHWHKRIVVEACNAGKDIYCEKPMSHTIADGFEMVDAAKRNNRIVQIGSQRVSSSLCKKAREMYSSDSIGEIEHIELSLGGIFRWKDGRNMPDLHLVLFDYHGIPVFVRLGLGTETPELLRYMGPKGILEANGSTLRYSPQPGIDLYPSYYAVGFPQKMRAEYETQWYDENAPKPGKEPVYDEVYYQGHDWDDIRPHLWNFFEAVKSRNPVAEDAVFGNHAAIACHMANEAYFHGKTVYWDESSKNIKS